jgi:membrane protease YdiL (CAAX protease family)
VSRGAPPDPLALGELLGVAIGALALALIAATALQGFGLLGRVLVPLIGFAAPALALAHRRGGVGPALGLVRPRAGALVGAVLVGGSLWLLVVVALAPLLELVPDREATEQALSGLVDPDRPLALRLAAFAVVPALTEELLCRGLLCRHLAARLGPLAGVALSTLYFAGLHLSLAQGLPALVTGAVCGVVALRARSTVAAIVVHALHNACILLAASPDLVVGDLLGAHGAWFVLPAAAATALGMSLIMRSDPGSLR